MNDKLTSEFINKIESDFLSSQIDFSRKILENNGYFVGKWIPIEQYKGTGKKVLVRNNHGIAIDSMKKGKSLKGQPTGYQWHLIGGEFPEYFMYLPNGYARGKKEEEQCLQKKI